MLTRRDDWQTRLQSFLVLHETTRFRYGVFDCCLFVCDAIREMTGTDVAAGLRGEYGSASQARALIHSMTGAYSVEAVTELITKRFEMTEELRLLMCHRGDIVLIKRARGFSLGLVALNGRVILVCARRGIIQVPIERAVRAWRV